MPILGGYTRFREHQWGYQGSNASLIATAVAAVRVMPLRGTPDVNRNVTWSESDQGSIDPIAAPYYTALDISESLEGVVAYNDIPWYTSVAVKSGITPTGGGTAKTWTTQAASLTADPVGFVTEEFGDDVLTDWYQLVGGVAESLTIAGPDDMGPLTVGLDMRFAAFKSTGSTALPVSGTVPTPALTVDASPTRVFLADGELFIDDAYTGIGATKITDALVSFNLAVRNEIDQKRAANGSNTRFQLVGLPRAGREITLSLQFHKTTATVGTGSESDDWTANTPVKRFVELRFTSPEIITGSTPYSWSLRMPLFYTTREDTDLNNNTTVTLTGTAVYDANLGYALRSVAVNSLATPSPL